MKIQIQSIGKVEAKPAEDFNVGEKMLWNFGYTSEVLSVVKETRSQIIYELSSISDRGVKSSETHERRFSKTRLVAIA